MLNEWDKEDETDDPEEIARRVAEWEEFKTGMNAVIVLDSGPVGMLTRREGIPVADECRKWQRGLLSQGVRVTLPEIVEARSIVGARDGDLGQ